MANLSAADVRCFRVGAVFSHCDQPSGFPESGGAANPLVSRAGLEDPSRPPLEQMPKTRNDFVQRIEELISELQQQRQSPIVERALRDSSPLRWESPAPSAMALPPSVEGLATRAPRALLSSEGDVCFLDPARSGAARSQIYAGYAELCQLMTEAVIGPHKLL